VACFDAVGEADLAIHDPTGLGQPWLTRRIRPTGEEQELVVDESHFGILAGRLADAFGNVPAGMHLEAYETSARMPVPIRLDAKTGRFRSQLQPGTYRLVALGDHGGASLGNAEVASGERSRMGRVDPPALGQVELRADRPRNGGNYRLQVCFGHTAVKWKEGALPLFLDEPLHAGLYRLDASDDEGVLQSGWVEVRAGSASALDLGALPRVQVEARAHSDPSAAVWLTVLPAGAPEPPAEDPQRRILFSRRSDGRCLHTLRLPPGRWKLTAEEKGEESAGAETVVDVEEGGNARVLLDLVRRPR
jgi:hypothetical protein